MAIEEFEVTRLNSAEVFISLEFPQTSFFADIGPTVSPNDLLAIKLRDRLSGLLIPGVEFFDKVVINYTERKIYLSLSSQDQGLFQTKGAILTIVELIQQAVSLLENNSLQPDGLVPLDVLIRSEPLRKLLGILADCRALNAKVTIATGPGERLELALPDRAWLASPPNRKSVSLAQVEVTGVRLGLAGEHEVELNRSLKIWVCTDIRTARLLVGKPHSFSGSLISSGSKLMVDASKPWRFDLIPVQAELDSDPDD